MKFALTLVSNTALTAFCFCDRVEELIANSRHQSFSRDILKSLIGNLDVIRYRTKWMKILGTLRKHRSCKIMTGIRIRFCLTKVSKAFQNTAGAGGRSQIHLCWL
jgi:hypothetical protein